MQTPNFRYFVLIAALAATAGLYAQLGQAQANSGTPRWPDLESISAMESWSSGPQLVEHNNDAGHNTDVVTRTFRNSAGVAATLTVFTSQAPKLYGAGAEVPFLGNGYTVRPAPGEVLPLEDHGVKALIAERGTEQWLVMYAYGERRGLLGNGAMPWTLAVVDGLLGRPNDYYKLYLMARMAPFQSGGGHDVAMLAESLFVSIAASYAV